MINTQEHDKGKQLSQCTSLGINSHRQETTAERKAKIENNNKDPTKASRMAVTPRYTLTSLHSATAAVIRTTRAQIVQRRTPFQRRIGQWQSASAASAAAQDQEDDEQSEQSGGAISALTSRSQKTSSSRRSSSKKGWNAMQVNLHNNDTRRHAYSDSILLDSASTIDIFCNQKLVTDV
jgi:hypothetical protein